MKRLILAALLVLTLAALPFYVFASGDTGGEAELREVFRFDFENGSTSGLFWKSSQVCETRESIGNGFLAYGLTSDYSEGSYLQLLASNLSSDYLTDNSVSSSKQYYNSETFTLSFSMIASEKNPANAYIEYKNAGKTVTGQLLFFRDGKVQTPGGTLVGELSKGSWLNVTLTLNVKTGEVSYFANGKLVASETISKQADNVSYFNFYVTNSEGNASAELWIDNLSLCFGEASESDTAYFAYAFEGAGSPTPVKVEFESSSGVAVEQYATETFLMPDTYPYWYGRVNGQNLLLKAGDEVKLYKGLSFKAIESLPTLLEGASIRADSYSGLRFGATYEIAWYDALEDFFGMSAMTVGVLIVPSDYLADGTAFTHAALSEKYDVLADIVNRRWYSEEGVYSCYGTLSDLKDENYARKFSARAYLKIVDDKGVETYLYSPYVEADHSRSAHQVATAAYADTTSGYTPEMKEAIKGYLDGVLALTYEGGTVSIVSGPSGYTSPYTLTESSEIGAVFSIASGTTLRSVTVNGAPIYDFTVGDNGVTVTLAQKGE